MTMPRSGRAAGPSPSGATLFRRWEALHGSRPAVLYHYTTASGLLSMIKSGHLWATELRYMNDPREFLHGAEVILGVIKQIAKQKNAPRAVNLRSSAVTVAPPSPPVSRSAFNPTLA